jgi:UDP-N-acetylglucosamine 2-epimerase (non-hydrolysing)
VSALRVLSIFGTRPEAVKMAPVVKELLRTPGVESHVCVTAQHREMLDQVLRLFDICPDVDLNLMRPNQTLAQLTASILEKLDPVLTETQPDWILVQGDTTTVMAAALLGFYHRIRVGHVEAGLRTYDRWQPFPEEINRRIAGVVADLHFAPTEHSRQNLLKENVPSDSIVVTGNPAIDALRSITRLDPPPEIQALLERKNIGPGGKQLVMITAHRRENLGQPLEDICHALREIAETYASRLELIYAVHLNPKVQEPVYRLLQDVPNITLTAPQDYLPMVHLMKQSVLVLTDSGGIQEEATSLGIPTLVLREVTERPEGVEAGVLKLVGTDRKRIVGEARHLLEDEAAYQQMACAANPFGDGHAAERIVAALLAFSREQGLPGAG